MPNYKSICKINDLKPGMRLGEDVISADNRVLLVAGAMLTAKQICRLSHMGVHAVSILITDQPEAMPVDFYAKYNELVSSLEASFKHAQLFNEVPIAAMKELVAHSLQPLSESAGVLSYLHLLKNKDLYTFQHSVNVAVICGVLGKWLGFKGVELLDLIFAGLLHDIGKAFVPDEILNKPGKFSQEEFNIMQRHPSDAYRLLENAELPLRVKHGILQHHERVDGSGYPIGLKDTAINDYAKIIAVADIFDAMTSDRCYRAAQTPFSAAETIAEQMFSKLEPAVCLTFLSHMREYYLGNKVRLSDGRVGEIVGFRPQASRPIVRTDDGQLLELAKNSPIKITSFYK